MPAYRERLTPTPAWFLLAPLAGVTAGLLVLPLVDPVVAVVLGVVATVGVALWLVLSSPVVAVTGGELHAGSARIPVSLLGAARALDASEARHELGPGLDARTYVCMRAWLSRAVLVDVTDPADPTPAWYVSSRRPEALAAAVRAAQSGASAQEAHSEQTG